ncbi:hypothetical protein V8J82_10795 [Gymnodinialimonas sp. 2305UL16-5]|uniref:hypothetical protein n=1 Tax=Gymnodinialimonas mytili TaxID=3126503 RepID=UPI003094F7BB
MSLDFDMTLLAVSFAILFAVLLLLHRTWRDLGRLEKSIRDLHVTQQRRSISLIKIENDLGALMECTVALAEGDPKKETAVLEALTVNRHNRLKSRLRNGIGVGDQLRGLQIPTGEDDPWFAGKEWIEDVVPEADNDRRVAT